jgi:hypothetical protein
MRQITTVTDTQNKTVPGKTIRYIAVLLFPIIFAAMFVNTYDYRRMITGMVSDESGEPLNGAVVQLKNLTSLEVRSYITQRGGKYLFCGLYSETDYQVTVLYKGRFSRTKRVSRFDSRRTVKVDFHIKVP